MITYLSPKCLKSVGKIKKTDFFPPKPGFRQSWTKVLGTVLQYSYFSVISRFPLKRVHPFRNFLAVIPPPPYTKLKLGKNSGYTRPTLLVGWGEGLDLCEMENSPETQKCPKTFVHDCSLSVMKPIRMRINWQLSKSDTRWQLSHDHPRARMKD